MFYFELNIEMGIWNLVEKYRANGGHKEFFRSQFFVCQFCVYDLQDDEDNANLYSPWSEPFEKVMKAKLMFAPYSV